MPENEKEVLFEVAGSDEAIQGIYTGGSKGFFVQTNRRVVWVPTDKPIGLLTS